MIDLSPAHAVVVRDIFKKNLPKANIYVFGSRVTGKAKPHSDLDLAIDTEDGLTLSQLSKMTEEFSNSALPFRVDLVDLKNVDANFKKLILDQYEIFS